MLRVKFADQASRDAFATRFQLESKFGEDELDIGWHLLQFAKLDDKALDYNEIVPLQSDGSGAVLTHEFIVKGDPNVFGPHATIKTDLGNGFYLVESTDGTVLGDHVDSIEHNKHGMTFLEACDITSTELSETSLDPTTPDGHWARIRVASRYRPLNTSFQMVQLDYKSKPEFIVMDTGINFDHPEFDYPELETEDFYTLPAFNGEFRDDKGHGTAVASMAVGKNLGIANYCKLVNVKIGSATHSATLLEVGLAIDAIMSRVSNDPLQTRIVNMSWGIARSSWLDAKVQSLQDAGVTVVCAAGNQGISVEDISPAGLDSTITVGSIDKYDIPSGFNNISPSDENVTTGHGLSLDIFAPGEGVVVANSKTGGYGFGSGTSFSAPLVAGVGVTLAALYEGLVPYTQLKEMILNTATKDALLFEDDRFSENQNILAYLVTSDQLTNYKDSTMTSYLGIHGPTDEPIVLDLNSSISKDTYSGAFPNDTYTYGIKFLDTATEEKYGEFITVNAITGMVSIAKPTVALPEETKLEMVQFLGTLKSDRISIDTNIMFFFHTNPLYKDTLQSDITLALSNTNSISFYGQWTAIIK